MMGFLWLQLLDPEEISGRIDVSNRVFPNEQEVAYELVKMEVSISQIVISAKHNEDESKC